VPPKVPFKQADVGAALAAGLDESAFRDSLNSSLPEDASLLLLDDDDVLSAKRRPSKRSLKALELSDEELSEEPVEQADSDFQPEGRSAGVSKRARHSLAASSVTPKIATRKRSAKGSVQALSKNNRGVNGRRANSQSVPPSPLTPSVKGASFLDKFCPCSVAGHTCQDENCKRQQLCSVSTARYIQHDMN
jgi:hypothetical protein